MPKVSIIIPAKDEEVTLPAVLADINKVTPTLSGWEVETIVVDDRSTDRTAELAKAAGAKRDRKQTEPDLWKD